MSELERNPSEQARPEVSASEVVCAKTDDRERLFRDAIRIQRPSLRRQNQGEDDDT
jgi:hypothetical protein